MVVRLVNLLFGVLLIVWAFLDDPFIGGEIGFGGSQAALLAAGLVISLTSLLKVEYVKVFLTLFVATATALGASELLLRALYAPHYIAPFELDDTYVYRLTPGAVRAFPHAPVNGGGEVLYQVNEDGFRGEPLATRDDLQRVVVYGDSFIQAEFSELQDTFSEQLEKNLTSIRGREVEVVNAGVAGFGPDQSYLRLRQEISWLAPDLVVFAVYAGNDFGDLVRNKLYRVVDGEVVTNQPRLEPSLVRNFEISPYESIIKKILRGAKNSMTGVAPPHLERADWRGRLANLEAEYVNFVEDNDDTVRVLLTDDYNADFALRPDSPSVSYKRQLMRGVLDRVAEFSAEHDLPILLLVIPHPIDVSDGNHESGVIDRETYPAYDPRRMTDTVAELAADAGLPVLDLFDAFAAIGTDRLYLKGGDDHWNNEGQKLAAEIVAQKIVNDRFLPQTN